MPTFRLTLEYEGTRYRGWQEQQNARTVAGEVRKAIERVAGPIGELGGAGRTDAGVHALSQTAHLRFREVGGLQRRIDPALLRANVNDLLPADIHLLSVGPAPERFHARHSALSRSYLYQISERRTAFAKRFVWWPQFALDVARIEAAARTIPGRHDFSLFCEKPDDQNSTIVVVERVEVARVGALVLIRMVASHFLWRMVRRLVGALVRVGSGRLEPDLFGKLVEGAVPGPGQETPAQWTAPPSGLFLERVLYPGDAPLPAIAPAFPVAEEARFQDPPRGTKR